VPTRGTSHWGHPLRVERRGSFSSSFFLRGQDRHAAPVRSSHFPPKDPLWKKTAPRPGQGGKGQRRTAGGTAAWPAGLPRPPHLVAAPPRCPPRPGRRKNGPERPLDAPTKSHSLIRKRPLFSAALCLCNTGALLCLYDQARPDGTWISGSVDQWRKVLPRRSRDQTQATRGANDPPQGQLACLPRAFACVLNTRGFPQMFYTAPITHPVRVHKYPWQAS
jgi:hypothetical protein